MGGVELARAVLNPSAESQVIARFVEPPPEVVAAVEALGGRRSLARKLPMVMNHVLMAACLDSQTAADAYLEGSFRGAFTYFLARTLREAGRQLDRHELAARLARALKTAGFSQVPQLEPEGLSGPLFSAMEPAKEQPHPPDGASPPKPSLEPPTGPTPIASSEAVALFREFLQTSNRLIDLIRTTGGPELAQAEPKVLQARQLVYVHGIGTHLPGFSDAWWEAMRPYVPILWPGKLGGNRHEAYWSDLVNRIPAPKAAAEAVAPESASEAEARQVAEELRAALQDRIQQQKTVAAAAAHIAGQPEDATRDLVEPQGQAEIAVAHGLGPFGGIDDFARYLTDRPLRKQILNRFRQTVLPLLQAGNSVEIIAHSWGTVIAYEALRLWDAETTLPADSVHNFFTVGSALSIPPVKSRLLPEVRDGRKPRLVRQWLNLDAQGDPVGGWLRGQPFQVDREFPNLPAVGCTRILWILPDPVCAHSSYFVDANVEVNRDIFGRYIEQP